MPLVFEVVFSMAVISQIESIEVGWVGGGGVGWGGVGWGGVSGRGRWGAIGGLKKTF